MKSTMFVAIVLAGLAGGMAHNAPFVHTHRDRPQSQQTQYQRPQPQQPQRQQPQPQQPQPQLQPTPWYFPSYGGQENCMQTFVKENVKVYDRNTFDCSNRRTGEQICNCISQQVTSTKLDDGSTFRKFCVECQMGALPLSYHYERFQELTFWKQLLINLAGLDVNGYESTFGPYRTMVLPASTNTSIAVIRKLAEDIRKKVEESNPYANGREYAKAIIDRATPFCKAN